MNHMLHAKCGRIMWAKKNLIKKKLIKSTIFLIKNEGEENTQRIK